MLEPLFPPRVGQVLNAFGAITGAGIAISEATLNSSSGGLPFIVVGTLTAVGFAARFAGVSWAISHSSWTMPWLPRVLSWLAFGVVAVLVALVGAPRVMIGFGAFVALDAATGFVKREVKTVVKPKTKGLWSRVKLPLFVGLYLAFVATIHFTVSIYLPYGTLVTWSLLALGFVTLVRRTLVGTKAVEAMLHAPSDHKKHERREEMVPDPQRERAEQVLYALRARGDAGAFLGFVRDIARETDVPAPQLAELEQRIISSFARAGTRREQDIDAALAEVERFLSLKQVERS